MIEKSVVEKIIDHLENISKSPNNNIEDLLTGRPLDWIQLRNFISNLPAESLIDLCALMDYGRENYQKENRQKNSSEFEAIRSSVAATVKEQDGKNIASYLLEKGDHLKRYLQASLCLYE